MNKITLDQWAALVAVVESGGYAQAAESVHKSQSTISYAIKTLEDRLNTEVFQIQGRRAVLTNQGKQLYRQARRLLDKASDLETLAANLAAGWEPEIRVAVDVIFPLGFVFSALKSFETECATTRVELYESVLSGTQDLITSGQVDLAIVGLVPAGFIGTPLQQMDFLLVASPGHPLNCLDRELSLRDLESHRHLVVRDSGSADIDSGWLGIEKRWTVSSLHASIEAICRGLGFAWLPRAHIQAHLDNGELLPLPLADGGRRSVMLNLVLSRPDSAGPATRRLAELLKHRCSEFA
jgi:DNA-binding transcriptional LysR family regulator